MSGAVHDLSPEAVLCLARWFAGPRDDLRSHEPHATLNKHRAAMDELVANGFLTVEPCNRAGSLWYRSTPKAEGIGWAERSRQIADLFTPAHDDCADPLASPTPRLPARPAPGCDDGE